MRESIFRPEGLGYVCEFPEIRTTFHVDRLRVSSGDMKGHVMVKTALKGARTYADGVLHYSQENLSSSTSRKSLGGTLEKKVPSDPPIDWFGMYDEFCTMVMLADRAGSPPDVVGDLADTGVHRLLFNPLVPLGVHSILFGDGGLGKSILAIAASVSIQTGREIIEGFVPEETGPVLYLNWETSKEDIDQRVKAVCKGAGIKPVTMYHVYGNGRPLAQRVEAVARIVDQTGAVMLVVDSSGKAIGTSGEGPIEDAANRFASALDEIGRTTLCIDHVSKAGAQTHGGAGKPYGSTMKTNWARATWELTQASEPDDAGAHLVLHHRKHNTTSEHSPIGLRMIWEDGSVRWEQEAVNPSALAYGGTLVERIEAPLAGHPLRPMEIAQRIGSKDNIVRAVLSSNKERFTRLDSGDWMTVD